MSTYVMSDIHGRYDEYLEMLLKINFSHKDKLYILGDVIDRGQNPIKVLRHTMYADNIILLMGNHEKMMLDSASTDEEKRLEANDMWEWNGGYTTKREFFELSKEVRQEIIDYIAELKWYEFVEIGDKKYEFKTKEGIKEMDQVDFVLNLLNNDQSSRRIMTNIFNHEELKDMTIITIAQRVASVRNADKIVVLNDGEIASIGSHDELIVNCPIYQEIYNSQLKKDGE